MAEVGVLNLEVNANTSSAEQKLKSLGDALSRVKEAVSGGLKLSSVARQIKELADAVNNNISDSTISKVGKLADELSKLKGFENVRINIKVNNAISGAIEELETGYKQVQEYNDKLEQVGNTVSRAKDSTDEFALAVGRANEAIQSMSMQNDGWTSWFDLFKQKLNDFLRMRSAMALGAGPEMGLTKSWKNDAIEVEGTVTDACQRIEGTMSGACQSVNNNLEGTRQLLLESGEDGMRVFSSLNGVIANSTEQEMGSLQELEKRINDVKDEAAKLEAIRKNKEEKFYEPSVPHYSFEQTNAMADNLTQLDLLKAKLHEAEIKYNQFVNELGAGSSKAVQAGLAVSKLRDEIWQYKQDLEEAKNVAERQSFSMNETNYMSQFVTQLDLLKARLVEAETQYNKYVNELGASSPKALQAALAVQKLREQINEYFKSLTEAVEETKEASQEVQNSQGIFSRLGEGIKKLFPTLSGLVSRFAQIAKYRMLRAVLKHITAGFTEGVQNLYQYSKLVGTSLAPAMDSAATAFQQLKNSVGAAVAPLIQMFIPIIKQVVNVVIEGINYLNQFFALLNGQATWTRALPETAEAFNSTKKSAKGASKAMKDLLADWDELNIIQSQNNNASAGTIGGHTEEEYKNMFEEVNKFDQGVKDALSFIDEHLGGIPGILKKAGAILLGWKFSKTFSGLLGALGSLVAGGALISIGLELGYGTGFEVGQKGYFDTADILKLIGGTLASALGGKLIGTALGIGSTGILIGLTAFAVVTIAGIINGSNKALDDAKWGDIHKTKDEIDRYVREQFTFPVDAEINLMKAHIANEQNAKQVVNDTVNDFTTSLDAANVVIKADTEDAETKVQAVKKAATDAQEAIKAIQQLIDTNEEGLKFTLTNFTFRDAEGNDITSDLINSIKLSDTTLKNYFTDIGAQLANLILEGEKNEWKNNELQQAMELMESQRRIVDRSKELEADIKLETELKAGVRGVVDKETALQTMEEQKQLIRDYIATSEELVRAQADTRMQLAAYAKAASEEEAAKGNVEKAMDLYATYADLVDEAEGLLAGLTNGEYGINSEKLKATKEKMAKEWAETLKKVYGEDYVKSNVLAQTNDQGGIGAFLDNLFGIGHSTESIIRRYIEEGGIDSAASILYQTVVGSLSSVDPNGVTSWFANGLGGNVYDLLTDELREGIARNLLNNTDSNDIAYQLFAKMFKLEPDEAKRIFAGVTGEIKEAVEQTNDNNGGVLLANATDLIDTEQTQTAVHEAVQGVKNEVESEIEKATVHVGDNGFKVDWSQWQNPEVYDPYASGAITPENVYEETSAAVNDGLNSVDMSRVDETAHEVGKTYAEALKEELETGGLSNGAQAIMQYVLNAVQSGKGIDEITAATLQGITDNGPEAWVEVQDIVNEIVSAYREMEKNGFVDTEAIMRKYGQYGTAGVPSGEQVHLDEGDLSSGVQAGTERANAEQNTILREIERVLRLINNKPNTVVYAPNTTAARVNKQSDVMFANVTGDV